MFLLLSFLLLPLTIHPMRNDTGYENDSEFRSPQKRIKRNSDEPSPSFVRVKRITMGSLTFGELDGYIENSRTVCRADLSGPGFNSCKGIEEAFEAKGIDPSCIVRLNLDDNELRIDRYLLSLLSQTSNLMTLSLANNNITHIPAQFIAVLNKLSLLQYVCIDSDEWSVSLNDKALNQAAFHVQLAFARGKRYTLSSYLQDDGNNR